MFVSFLWPSGSMVLTWGSGATTPAQGCGGSGRVGAMIVIQTGMCPIISFITLVPVRLIYKIDVFEYVVFASGKIESCKVLPYIEPKTWPIQTNTDKN